MEIVRKKAMYRYLMVLTIASTVGLQAWTTLFNHIAAVALPAVGGLLWMVDYRIPFLAGAGMSLVSLVAVQWIRVAPDRRPGFR